MKIAMITETFLPSTDGVVTRLCASIQWLQANGHVVCVIAPDLGVNEYAGAVVCGVPAHTFLLYKDKQFSLPSRKVRKYLFDFQPDVVHVVNPAFLGIAGLYYARRLGAPLIASYHTNVPQYADYYHVPFLKPALWWYFRTLHNRAQVNLCTSRTVQQELGDKGFRNVQLWQRGVATDTYGSHYYSEVMRERLTQGQPGKRLLLYVGRLAPEKEIEKIREVLQTSPDYCLAIVGDGPNRANLEHHFRNTNTVFTGFMHKQELAETYASADIFVFPSTTETLGLVLLEALASGLPVVAADSGPTREQIQDGVTGVLYNPKLHGSFTHAVWRLSDEGFRKTLSQNASEVAHNLGWSQACEQLLGFYVQACGAYASDREMYPTQI